MSNKVLKDANDQLINIDSSNLSSFSDEVVHKAWAEYITGNKYFVNNKICFTDNSTSQVPNFYLTQANATTLKVTNSGTTTLGEMTFTVSSDLPYGALSISSSGKVAHTNGYSSDFPDTYLQLPLGKGSKVGSITTYATLATTDDFSEEITYSALKIKRDSGELVPGKFYRITDYQCTSATTNTSVENNLFDIIVLATSNNTLSEEASAYWHTGSTINGVKEITIDIDGVNTIFSRNYLADGYYTEDFSQYKYAAYSTSDLTKFIYVSMSFSYSIGIPISVLPVVKFNTRASSFVPLSTAGITERESIQAVDRQFGVLRDKYFVENLSNLPSWKLKYCLDNDTNRFNWATDTGCDYIIVSVDGYDISMVRFNRCQELDEDFGRGHYAWLKDGQKYDNYLTDVIFTANEDSTGDASYGSFEDGSDIAHSDDVTIRDHQYQSSGKGVIYYMKDNNENEAPYDFKNIKFYTTFIGDYVHTFTDSYYSGNVRYFKDISTAAISDSGNTAMARGNIIEAAYTSWVNSSCHKLNFNIIYCYRPYNNIFKANCTDNILYCMSATNVIFDAGCYHNIININATISSIYLGPGCYQNSLGGATSLDMIKLMTGCHHITTSAGPHTNLIIGENCSYINFYYDNNIIIDPNCSYIHIGVGSSGGTQAKNSHIHSNIHGTASSYKELACDPSGDATIDYYAKGSTNVYLN